MYDQTKLVDVEGQVREFQWTNPHVILWVTRDAEAGKEPELWTIELPTSTGNLARMDWSKRSLVPGDRVKVEINPLRDGQHGGSFKKVTIAATGKVLTASPPAATPTGEDAGIPAQPSAASITNQPAKPAARSGCACSAFGVRSQQLPWMASIGVIAALALRRRYRRQQE